MAGVEDRAEAKGGGPLSPLARAQYGALAAMRWNMLRNSLRSSQGAFELGARAVAYLIYGAMGLGLGVGAGVGAGMLTENRAWQYLPILFWLLFMLWQAVPVALASFQEQYDMSGLLRYPLDFRAYFGLFLVFGLADISTLLGGLCCTGILVGITVVRPDLFVWTLLGLAGFAAFNVLLVRVILAWIDRWLARRRTREIVSALFLMFLLGLQLLNPALHEEKRRAGKGPGPNAAVSQMQERMRPALAAAHGVQEWLPPGLAAAQIEHASGAREMRAAASLVVLGLWVLAAGGLLGVRLKAEYRGENLSEAPARQSAEKRGAWLLDGAGPIAAVMEKELRTLVRSLPLLYALGAPLVMVLVFGSLMRGDVSNGGHPFGLALPVCVGYALLGSSQIIYNALGVEGPGVQLLFLSPTPMRTVLLAKNIFHSLLFLIVALLAGVMASLRLGAPSTAMVVSTLAWMAFALPANLAVGNVFSLIMPHRMNLGQLKRRRASASTALLSMLVQFALLGVGAAVFATCYFHGGLWWAVPVFLALAVGAVFGWLWVLRLCDRIAANRKDNIIARLSRAE